MNLKQLLTEDRAVSPVIGVILMVAITVILAAVIGTFVLGLGDQVSESAPQAQFTFDYNQSGDILTATHDGGDEISSTALNFTYNGTSLTWANATTGASDAGTEYAVSAGNSSTIGDATDEKLVGSDDTVRIVWNSPNSDKTATIAKFDS